MTSRMFADVVSLIVYSFALGVFVTLHDYASSVIFAGLVIVYAYSLRSNIRCGL